MIYTAAVITISDKGSQGLLEDTSGPALCAMLQTSSIPPTAARCVLFALSGAISC